MLPIISLDHYSMKLLLQNYEQKVYNGYEGRDDVAKAVPTASVPMFHYW